MTRKELKELCVTLCDRFPFAAATGTRKSWLGPIIGKPCGSSTRCSKSPSDATPCRHTEDTVPPRPSARYDKRGCLPFPLAAALPVAQKRRDHFRTPATLI